MYSTRNFHKANVLELFKKYDQHPRCPHLGSVTTFTTTLTSSITHSFLNFKTWYHIVVYLLEDKLILFVKFIHIVGYGCS